MTTETQAAVPAVTGGLGEPVSSGRRSSGKRRSSRKRSAIPPGPLPEAAAEEGVEGDSTPSHGAERLGSCGELELARGELAEADSPSTLAGAGLTTVSHGRPYRFHS
jgi:hypothetical protein